MRPAAALLSNQISGAMVDARDRPPAKGRRGRRGPVIESCQWPHFGTLVAEPGRLLFSEPWAVVREEEQLRYIDQHEYAGRNWGCMLREGSLLVVRAQDSPSSTIPRPLILVAIPPRLQTTRAFVPERGMDYPASQALAVGRLAPVVSPGATAIRLHAKPQCAVDREPLGVPDIPRRSPTPSPSHPCPCHRGHARARRDDTSLSGLQIHGHWLVWSLSVPLCT